MLKQFSDTYGPYAFGLIALLIIWYAIVHPQLERTKVDYEEFTRGADTMQDAAQTLRHTAEVMERTSVRLERMDERSTARR